MDQRTPVAEPAGGTSQPSVSIERAASILGVSPSTARRWVKEGRLRSQKVTTPQGHVFRVHLPAEPSTSPTVAPGTVGPRAGSATPSVEPSAALSVERAGAMASYNASLIGPLVAELSETRVKLVAQAEEIGRLRAQLDAAQQTIRALQAPESQQTREDANLGPIEPDPPFGEPSEPPSPAPLPPTLDGSGRAPWWRRWVGWL